MNESRSDFVKDRDRKSRPRVPVTRLDAMESEPLIPKHGGYRKLKSFQVAELVYDVTVRFCDKYIERRRRTHDQMVQPLVPACRTSR